jgi:uncharacterized membrane protein YoaK (UPF0700 family)
LIILRLFVIEALKNLLVKLSRRGYVIGEVKKMLNLYNLWIIFLVAVAAFAFGVACGIVLVEWIEDNAAPERPKL